MTSDLNQLILRAGVMALLLSLTTSFSLAQSAGAADEQDPEYPAAAVRAHRDAAAVIAAQAAQAQRGLTDATRATTIWQTSRQSPLGVATAGANGSGFFGVTTGRTYGTLAANRESEQKIMEIRRQISAAEDDAEKEKLKADLKTQLESDYDTYLDQLEAPLKEMEARVDRLREEFDKRKQAREELIKLRLDTLWYEANGMGWPGGQSAGPFGGRYLPAPGSISNVPAIFPGGDGTTLYPPPFSTVPSAIPGLPTVPSEVPAPAAAPAPPRQDQAGR